MENVSGYARILARTRVEQEQNKPFFGKPYLKYGQCFGIWGYFFQLGGILGARYSAKLDAFGPAFLGARGNPGAIEQFFTEVAKRLVADSLSDSMTFADYVGKEFMGRIGYKGDETSFFFKHGMEKIDLQTATELAWQYAQQGAALGAIHPHVVRKMYEQTHRIVPKKDWEQARAAGLNIPPEQTVMTYEEVEQGEDEVFMAYCRECCPNLHSVLTA